MTTATFVAPLRRTDTPAPETARRSALRALIVDDDTELRPLFCCALDRLQPAFRMDWASGVEEAFAILRRRRHSLVVADHWLPDGSGLALGRWARLFTPESPFAVISGASVAPELLRSVGPEIRFLPKPFSIPELQRFLEGLAEGVDARATRRRLAG